MTLTKVQVGSGGAASTTASITYGAAPAIGDLMVVFVSVAQTMTASNGFARLTVATQGTRQGAFFWKVAVSGDTGSSTVNVCTFTSGTWGSEGDTWNASTGWPANPVNANGENSQAVASTTSYTTPSVTPTTTGRESLVCTSYLTTTAGRTWSAQAVSGSNVGTITEELDTTSATFADGVISNVTGAYQGSATLSGTAQVGIGAIAIFTPNAAGAAVASACRLALMGVGV